MARVIVVGGGLAGLALAYSLKWRHTELPSGMDVEVLEQAGRAGGQLQTLRAGGFVVEAGPESFDADAPLTLALIQRLGLMDELLSARPEARRHLLFTGGAMQEVPERGVELLRSGLLPRGALLHLLKEPLAPPATPGLDETLGTFLRRRLGDQVAGPLAEYLARSAYAGDPDTLSAAAAFPELVEMERAHGSLLRASLARGAADRAGSELGRQKGFNLVDQVVGLLASNTAEAGMRKRAGAAGATGRSGPTSFAGGLATLTQALERALGARVHTGTTVLSVTGEAPGVLCGPYRVKVQTAQGERELTADGVVLAVPPPQAAPLVRELDDTLAAQLSHVPAEPGVVVALGVSRAQIGRPVDAGRYVVAPGQGLRHLGAWISSAHFDGRAPDGHALLRVVFGGVGDRGAATLGDEALTALAREELGRTLGLSGAPALSLVLRHAHAFPQYLAGHAGRVAAIERRLTLHPALALTGPGLYGAGLSATLIDVERVADRVVLALRHREGRR